MRRRSGSFIKRFQTEGGLSVRWIEHLVYPNDEDEQKELVLPVDSYNNYGIITGKMGEYLLETRFFLDKRVVSHHLNLTRNHL